MAKESPYDIESTVPPFEGLPAKEFMKQAHQLVKENPELAKASRQILERDYGHTHDWHMLEWMEHVEVKDLFKKIKVTKFICLICDEIKEIK